MKAFRAYIAIDPAQRQRFLDEDLMASVLPEIQSADPGPHTWATLGVVIPSPRGEMLYHRSTGNTVLLHFRLCERILPAATINDLTDKAIRHMLEQEGDDRKKATKKERAQVKHEIVTEELPKTHTKSKIIPVLIKGEYIVVGATSPKVCEDILSKLRAAFGSLQVLPFDTNATPTALLTELAREHSNTKLIKDESGYEGYALQAGHSGSLVDADSGKMTFTNTPTNSDYIEDALNHGHIVQELQVFAYSDHEAETPDAAVKVGKTLGFKGLKLAAGMIEARTEETAEYSDDEDAGDLAAMASFDANVLLTAEVVFGLIEAVADLSGGRHISDNEHKLAEEYRIAGHFQQLETDDSDDEELPDDYFDDL